MARSRRTRTRSAPAIPPVEPNGPTWQARSLHKLSVEAEFQARSAHIQVARLNHPAPSEHLFARKDVYWIDLCLTPRRPNARARYVDRWGEHRFAAMGSLIALPPRLNLHLRSEGGRHVSLICALQAAAVQQWLPAGFEWTDRRLEACLDISSAAIRRLMLQLFHEIRHETIGRREFVDALVLQLSIEIARRLVDTGEPIEGGGLAGWRLRVIDKRLAQHPHPPTLAELAGLCDLSVRQLTRGFRTSRGSSIREYVRQSRIDIAKRRLATDESLRSIAASLGFSSQSTFTYAFRRATGVTPRDFRQRILRAVRAAADAAADAD